MDAREILLSSAGELAVLCRRYRVERLALFGSAATRGFEPGRSDVDLLVDFEPMTPADHARAFFALGEDLERLLGAPVDLVEPSAIRNPYFGEAVQESQIVVYEAA